MNISKKYLQFDRLLLSKPWWKQIGVLFIFTALILAFSYLICHYVLQLPLSYAEDVNDDEPFWQYYYFFADPGNQMSMQGAEVQGIESARESVPLLSRILGMFISTLGSIFLAGLLISTITNIFERRKDKIQSGYNYHKFKNHVVIIGSHPMLTGIINQLLEKKNNFIVVLTTDDIEKTRNNIYAGLKDKNDFERILVNHGTRDSEEYLNKINIAQASEVYVLGDDSEFDEIENYHDTLNVQSLKIIADICRQKRKGTKLNCHILFDFKSTYNVFQYSNLPTSITNYIQFHPINYHEFWARKVLAVGVNKVSTAADKNDIIKYTPLDYDGITSVDDDRFVHFIVIGNSQMGQAMALQAAHIAHFPNYKKKKTRITIIDINGDTEMEEFKQKTGELFELCHSTFIDADAWNRSGEDSPYHFMREYHLNKQTYGHLVEHCASQHDSDFIDIEWNFIKGADHNPKVRKLLVDYVNEPGALVTVAVCLNITHQSLRCAMNLPRIFYDKEISILVQQRSTASISNFLNGTDGTDTNERFDGTNKPTNTSNLLYRNLKPFGIISDSYDTHIGSTLTYCKRVNAIYEAFYTQKEGEPLEINDETANDQWEELSTILKWSNIYAAASIPGKLRSLGYSAEDVFTGVTPLKPLTENQIKLLAEMEHNRWNVEKLLLGFRPVYRDEDQEIDNDKKKKKYYKNKKTHYDIRPFEGLKVDDMGKKATFYDRIIVENLHLIVNNKL